MYTVAAFEKQLFDVSVYEDLFDEDKWEEMSTSGIFENVRRTPHAEGEPTRLESAKARLQKISTRPDTAQNVRELAKLLTSEFPKGETWEPFWVREVFSRFRSVDFEDIYLDYAVLAHMNGMIDRHAVDLVFTHWTLKHYHPDCEAIGEHPLFVEGRIEEKMDSLLQARCFFQCFSTKYHIFRDEEENRAKFYQRVKAECLSSEKRLLVAKLGADRTAITSAITRAGIGMFSRGDGLHLIWPSRLLQIFYEVFLSDAVKLEPGFGASAFHTGIRSSAMRNARPLVMRSRYQPVSDTADGHQAKGIRQRQHDGYHGIISSCIDKEDRKLYRLFGDAIRGDGSDPLAVEMSNDFYEMEAVAYRPVIKAHHKKYGNTPQEKKAGQFWTSLAHAFQKFTRNVVESRISSFEELGENREKINLFIAQMIEVIWEQKEKYPEYSLSDLVCFVPHPEEAGTAFMAEFLIQMKDGLQKKNY